MDGINAQGSEDGIQDPPLRLFSRLAQIAGYSFDESVEPIHSSYDNWQVFGTKNSSKIPESDQGSEPGTLFDENPELNPIDVVARISTHALREERAFSICKALVKSVDPDGDHIIKPLDIVRLANVQGDKGPIVVCIFEHPGQNYLKKYLDYGPAYYRGRRVGEDEYEAFREAFLPDGLVPLQTFLDFAVGASEALEILHHGQRIVHGEIRADAFHMNKDTGKVKLINFGSGLRSFEHGLSSTGWSTLSKEVGSMVKLSYMSPEQTGRMPAEPDSRTDIYSLGILFWTMLTQQAPFDGNTPMDIIQGVLGRRLPIVSSIRMDIPDVIGKIIQKMTAKTIGERYHSVSGLRQDLIEVRRLLSFGDSAALKHWEIATKDVSSFFILPTVMFGREHEHNEVVKIIDKVARRHAIGQRQDVYSVSSGSSLSEGRLEIFNAAIGATGDISSEGDNTSSAEGRSNSLSNPTLFSGAHKASSNQLRSAASSIHNSLDSSQESSNRSHRSNPPNGNLKPWDSSQESSNRSIASNSNPQPWEKHKTIDSQDSLSRSNNSNTNLKPWEKNTSLSMDSRSVSESVNSEAVGLSSSDGVGSLTSHRNSQKFRRKGRCEVVTIAGAAGLGKSCLVQSVQVEARRRGYFASSKFDQAKKTPFGPLLKLLSSLFKQVFSESNTDTLFHQILKSYVRPAWPLLSKILELPEFLLGPMMLPSRVGHSNQLSQGYNKSLRAEIKRRDSSPSSSHGSLYNIALGAQSSQEFLRAGSSTKSMRLMNTFLDVLRVFTQHKFICFCLDDLQFCDDESLDLITQIVASQIKMCIIVTYRPDEILPEKIKSIVEPPNTEGISLRSQLQQIGCANINLGYIKAGGVGITRVVLRPLSEEDILQYVSTTLCRPKSEIIPLAAVIQSKTAGNPFYMREMLDTCHRKQCIWYDYRESCWQYDLDRVFKQFETQSYHDTLNTEFVTARLNELPSVSRSILAWASLIGTSFSFELIQRLLSGEFDYDRSDDSHAESTKFAALSHPQQDAVEGLQACIQAYIILGTQDDDRFRFSHDRYIQAAASLRGSNGPWHFIIAQTLQKYYSADERSRFSSASHICEAIHVINERVVHKQSFRRILFDCAQAAAESGARPTAAKFYANCFALLQKDPWDDGAVDVYYEETLELHLRAGECYLYMGHYHEAKRLLLIVFQNAKTPVDKAPAWVLQSRVFAQEGDSPGAFQALKQCLAALGIKVDDNPSFEKCDAEFERLSLKIQSMDPEELVSRYMAKDSNLAAVGAVLVETTSAAFWTDTLTFYHTSLVMVNTQLTCGNFPQAGMAFLHLAMIAITRFNMIKFASDMGNISCVLMDKWNDNYTMGRGGTIYSLFVGHLQVPLHHALGQLEGALEYAIQAGDRISTILNFGLVGNLKFFASDHLSDLEAFTFYALEEIPNWQQDTRGGTMVLAIRQVARALQGKTFTSTPFEIMSDTQHNSLLYKSWLRNTLNNADRPLLFYEGIEICPLFLYGHYDAAIKLGNANLARIDTVWSARNTRFLMLFHGLSLAGMMWAKLQNPIRTLFQQRPTLESRNSESYLKEELTEVIKLVSHLKRKIEDWQAVTDVNYLAWSKLLAAQISEMEEDHGAALRHYEESLDHASAHNFVFEEALGNYLLAGFFLRVGSRRPAKAALREAIMLYRQFGAVGVAKHIEDEHSLLLQGPTRNLRTADMAVQTDFAGDSVPVQYQTLEGDDDDVRQQTRASITETKDERIGAWQGGSARPDAGSGLPALDMLDLTSILESSQVISSVLQVDQLLKTMCEIILQNCGGLASTAAIVVEEDDGWSVAASGDPENGAQAHIPGLPLTETALVVEGVILYCTRFRETVFLPDLIHDERFSNVSPTWSARNPIGKSVIAIPICHGSKPILGVLYLEGQPNAFTDRNLTVLQLLVNQIGISYSNALTLKEVEKVSAFNNSMVDVQKKALAKAMRAEAEALRNVKLAEEAAKAKSIFLANVSHELRTPLNGVIGNSELLRDSDLRKDQAEMADSIRVSADLLLTVINDILDFSKMEADKMKLFIVAFNADEMIREVVRSVSYSNRDKKSSNNVEIVQDIHLPQSLIFGDPVRLHQVLGNLIGNSLKFTENGSITVGAKTDWETKDAVKLTFWVQDTGIGIPPKQLVKLFKPFSQADASTARKYGGSGLGLSICKSLIESMMGGQIHLESVENKGTTAWFTVTFAKANPEATPGDSQSGAEHRDPVTQYIDSEGQSVETENTYTDFSHIPREQLRICIAEDNPINQKIAIQFMEKLGFKHVDAYDNGKEAVEGLRKQAKEGRPYQIILMDVQMPVLDGYEATKLLRRDPLDAVRGILVIAMTASAIQGDREKCLASGMNDYLAKPVRSGVLKKKLDQYLLQPPIRIPNLQAEARQLAQNVMSGANGYASPAGSNPSGTSTPITPDRSSNRQAKMDPVKPNLRSRSSSPERKANRDLKHGGEGNPGNNRRGLDGSSDLSDKNSELRVHEERTSPNRLPLRPKSEFLDGAMERTSRDDRVTLENRPFSSNSDHRSNSVIRSPSIKSTASTNSKDSTEKKR